MVSVIVVPAGKAPSIACQLPYTVELPGKQVEDTTIGDIKVALAGRFPKFYPARQKIALKGNKNALQDEVKLIDAGVTDGGEVSVKDLGHQISWKTVFLVEYGGPLVIHPLLYHFPKVFWGGPVYHSTLQRFVYALVMIHFMKRELETLFVHRFSHGTMPLMNIFKNSAHYHLLSGLALALSVYSPNFGATSPYIRGTVRDDPTFIWACTAVWIFAEVSNLITHINLRHLRPEGTRKRAIPFGYGFSLVSFPNYFFESISWLTIAVMTGSFTGRLMIVICLVASFTFNVQLGYSLWFPPDRCISGQQRNTVRTRKNLETRIRRGGRPCSPLLRRYA
ncbi:3-oxo-5-alpha-steroid 4-dehydrogenase-domain-containing protein [Pisolithus orientalis]|uniref:3-oxo-5-alpha-steroid 4-dehydrogenase-domain-containing protein n=1 Tax=Pisolithus orientalis TaxID=936130 RepID=UPI00222426DE|nr:3-oxo-5-alpha-steroid 4-dehydrogenase-domain-containing protein [Pisolithus orientalis]KAI6025658.1 3-oxo-5-alpha-steroid 4-dehydrogenase-domain-containing protein [Pisolithus orientalis]